MSGTTPEFDALLPVSFRLFVTETVIRYAWNKRGGGCAAVSVGEGESNKKRIECNRGKSSTRFSWPLKLVGY